MKLDMHVHSIHSSDGKVPPRELLKRARKIGLGGICITDHNTLRGYRIARKLAPGFGLLVISGMEISSSAGHILGIGIREEIPKGLSPEETLERIRDQGGIAVAPHPFRQWSGLGPDIVNSIVPDAIEVLNAHSTSRDNMMARELCESMGLSMTAGSDAHERDMLGRAYVTIPDVSNEEDALIAIISGKVRVGGNSRSSHDALKDRTLTVTGWMGRGFKKM